MGVLNCYAIQAYKQVFGTNIVRIPGWPRISGINSGRNSMNAIYNQMVTKLRNRTTSNMTAVTAGKMFLGRAYETAVPYGVAGGALAGAIGGPLIPGYSDSCECK
ncbi:hypothetical protein FACS189475_01760 [Betaproteobacteria bacterium]|nr:hypothetical protein FACS189475_01760 [Betaproteobacteria bacterium]